MTITIPMVVPSVANLREHWSATAKRKAAQRAAVALMLPRRHLGKEINWLSLNGNVVVTLTRIAPRKLDGDNLQTALKAVRDQVAAQLDIDDGDERIGWHYQQEPGTTAIRIALALVDNRAPMEIPF